LNPKISLNRAGFARRLDSPSFELFFCLVLFSIPVIIAFAHGIGRPFHQEPDAGITWVYQTLLVTEGPRQTSWDHPAYVHLLLMGAWYLVLDGIGILSASTLSEVQAAPSLRDAFVDLIVAGRVFSGIFVGLMAVMFYTGLRSLAGRRVVAIVASLFLVFTTGFVEQTIRIHTELFSALFTYASFFLVLAAARNLGWRGFLWLALAATSATLAMLAKMQALPLLLALPLVALLVGRPTPVAWADPIARESTGRVLVVVTACLAISVIAMAMMMAQLTVLDQTPRVVSARVFQAVMAIYLLLAMVLYSLSYRPHWKPFILGPCALAAGISIGLYFLFISHYPKLFQVVVDYVDHMAGYSSPISMASQGGHGSSNDLFLFVTHTVLDNLRNVLHRSFLVFGEERSNLITPLYWTLGLGAVAVLVLGRWRLAAQLFLFLAIALGMEAFCRLRSFAGWYYVYVEPWIIIGNVQLCSFVLERASIDSRKAVYRSVFVGVSVFWLLAVPGSLLAAFEDRQYALQASYCGDNYSRAPKLPGLVCFESE